jgi:hypothetical protein
MVAEAQASTGSASIRALKAHWLLAALVVLPLLAPGVWYGFSLGLPSEVLGAVSPMEQPLSVRSLPGAWAVGVALLWFALAYRSQRAAWWEPMLVLAGSAAALLRAGNTWLDALALLAPLAMRFSDVHVTRPMLATLSVGCLATTLGVAVVTRPPSLPAGAIAAVGGGPRGCSVISNSGARCSAAADWLQRRRRTGLLTSSYHRRTMAGMRS